MFEWLTDLFSAGKKKDEPDYADVLEKNKSLNFVERLYNKDNYPSITNEDGTYSTHKMMSAVVEGIPMAMPTIIYDKKRAELKELSSKEAIDYAIKNKEFIRFKTEKEAEDFANNGYKRSLTGFSY